MKNNKLLIRIISVLIVLILPIIIYGYNSLSVIFDQDIYQKEFIKYGVYEILKDYDIEKINGNLLTYFGDGEKNNLIDDDFFNEREKIHLLDVKELLQLIKSIYNFSILLFFILLVMLIILMNHNYNKIAKHFLIIISIGSFLVVIDAILFWLLSNLNFNFVFNNFHKLFFSPGSFLFNPEFEKIVVLYPFGLFFDLLIKIITNTVFSSVILFLISIIFLFHFFSVKFPKIFKKIPSEKILNRKL